MDSDIQGAKALSGTAIEQCIKLSTEYSMEASIEPSKLSVPLCTTCRLGLHLRSNAYQVLMGMYADPECGSYCSLSDRNDDGTDDDADRAAVG